MELCHLLLCWDAPDFCFIASWILIYKSRRMLPSSMRFVLWRLLPCRSHTERGHLAKPKMRILAVALFQMITAAHSHPRRNAILIGSASLHMAGGKRPQNCRVSCKC